MSIIIPLFDNEKDIQSTINSILTQTYTDWEAIFVDDGCQDATMDIVARNSVTEPRIRYVKRTREPKGGSTCRNIGASVSNGDYIIFLDGDDVLAPTCLSNRIKTIEQTEYDFMVFPMSTFTNDINKNRRLTKWGIRDYDYYYITGAPAWQVTSPIYRRSFWDTLKGFDEGFTRSQDIELGLRSVIESHGNFKVIENIESDCFYRVALNNGVIPSYKYIKTLDSYGLLLSLIKRYKSNGFFLNRYKFSLGLLATYCHMYEYIYIILNRHEKVESFNYYNKVEMRGYMLWHHRMVVYMLGSLPLSVSIKRILAFRINQYCRWHFLF